MSRRSRGGVARPCALGREHADVCLGAEEEVVPGVMRNDVDLELAGLVEELVEFGALGVDAEPEFLRTEVGNDGGHSTHVVGVRVRDGDGVETMDATRPEIGRDDLLANVEVGMHPEGKASGVDEERVAVRRNDEEGVALSDVDGGDFEDAGLEARLRRNRGDDEGCEREGNESSEGVALALARGDRGEEQGRTLARMTGAEGVGTRISATRALPRRVTVLVIPRRASAAIEANGIAMWMEM